MLKILLSVAGTKEMIEVPIPKNIIHYINEIYIETDEVNVMFRPHFPYANAVTHTTVKRNFIKSFDSNPPEVKITVAERTGGGYSNRKDITIKANEVGNE